MQIKNLIERVSLADTDWLLLQSADGVTFKISRANFVKDFTTSSAQSGVKLTGTVFGTSPSYSSGTEFDKAFDSNTATFFDFVNANNGYTGIDLGASNTKKVTKIRFFPRPTLASRMVGGKFQGSNTSNSTGYTDIATIAGLSDGWNEIIVNASVAYRYLRYLSPDGSYGNVSEIEFYGA